MDPSSAASTNANASEHLPSDRPINNRKPVKADHAIDLSFASDGRGEGASPNGGCAAPPPSSASVTSTTQSVATTAVPTAATTVNTVQNDSRVSRRNSGTSPVQRKGTSPRSSPRTSPARRSPSPMHAQMNSRSRSPRSALNSSGRRSPSVSRTFSSGSMTGASSTGAVSSASSTLVSSSSSAFGKPGAAHGKKVPAGGAVAYLGRNAELRSPVNFIHPNDKQRASPPSFQQILRQKGKSPKNLQVPGFSSSSSSSATTGRKSTSPKLGLRANQDASVGGSLSMSAFASSSSAEGRREFEDADQQIQDPTPRDLEFLMARGDDLDAPLEVEFPTSAVTPPTMYYTPTGTGAFARISSVPTTNAHGPGAALPNTHIHHLPNGSHVAGGEDVRGRPGSQSLSDERRYRSSSWDSPRWDREGGSDRLNASLLSNRGKRSSQASVPDHGASTPHDATVMHDRPQPSTGHHQSTAVRGNVPKPGKDWLSGLSLEEVEEMEKLLTAQKQRLLKQKDSPVNLDDVPANPPSSTSNTATAELKPNESMIMGPPKMVFRGPDSERGGSTDSLSHAATGASTGNSGSVGRTKKRFGKGRSFARSASPVLKNISRKFSRDDTESLVSDGFEDITSIVGTMDDCDELTRPGSGCMAPDVKMFQSNQYPSRPSSRDSDFWNMENESDAATEYNGPKLSTSPGNLSFVCRVPRTADVANGKLRTMNQPHAEAENIVRHVQQHILSSSTGQASGGGLRAPDPSRGVDCISSPRSAFIRASSDEVAGSVQAISIPRTIPKR